MHEVSIAEALRDLAEKHRPAGATVRSLRVRVGPLRGIDPDAMQLAWSSVVTGTDYDQSKLNLVMNPWLMRCQSCKREWPREEIEFTCTCGSDRVFPVGGDELILDFLEVDEP